MLRLILWILPIFVKVVVNGDELKFVHAIWRHGFRAPGGLPYPLDNYDESYWPRGWDQLTDAGIEQMKELGQFFRNRYKSDYLNTYYNFDEIAIKSSKSQRALDSAYSFAKQFCTGGELINVDSNCPAIEATNYTKGDPLLKPTSYDCPSYDNKALHAYSQIALNLTQKFHPLLDFLAPLTGHGPNISLHKLAKLNDLNREVGHGLEQPTWVNRRWPEYDNNSTLEIATELKRLERTHEFNRPELARLRGGFLLADWLSRAKQVADGAQIKPSKMMLYSSHDGTLQALMYAMQIADNEQIPYAGTVIMELYQRENGEFYVKLFYRHDGQLIPKQLPDCEMECELSKFFSQLNDTAIYTVDLLENQCELSGDQTLEDGLKLDARSISKEFVNSGPQNLPAFINYILILPLLYEILFKEV